MNSFTKYLIYLLAVAIVLVVMLLLKDNISLWLSRVGTYVLMFGFTFFAGWLLGHMGGAAARRSCSGVSTNSKATIRGRPVRIRTRIRSSYNSKFNFNLNPEPESYAENTNQKTPT